MQKQILTTFDPEEFKATLSAIVKESIKELLPKEQKKYYTRAEVCKLLKVSLPTLHSFINKGKITALKIGGRTLFDADAINESIKTKEVLRYGR